MNARLTSEMLVAALLRRVAGAGGFGVVLHKGDAQAGAILILCSERGQEVALLERVLACDSTYAWARVGPEDESARRDYLAKRRRGDPDLWLVELDIADSQRFAAESLSSN